MTSDGYASAPSWPQMTSYVEGVVDPICQDIRDLRTRADRHDRWHTAQIERAIQGSRTWRLTVVGIVVAALGAIGTDAAVLISLAHHGG